MTNTTSTAYLQHLRTHLLVLTGQTEPLTALQILRRVTFQLRALLYTAVAIGISVVIGLSRNNHHSPWPSLTLIAFIALVWVVATCRALWLSGQLRAHS